MSHGMASHQSNFCCIKFNFSRKDAKMKKFAKPRMTNMRQTHNSFIYMILDCDVFVGICNTDSLFAYLVFFASRSETKNDTGEVKNRIWAIDT